MTQSYVDEYTGRRKLAERATVTAAEQQHTHAGSDTSSADAGSWLNAQQSQQQHVHAGSDTSPADAGSWLNAQQSQQQHEHAGSDTSSADAGSWLNVQQSQQQSSNKCMRAVTRRQRTQEAG